MTAAAIRPPSPSSPRGTVPWAWRHPSAQKTQASGYSIEACRKESQGSHQKAQKSTHKCLQRLSWRWSPRTSAPLSSKPHNVAFEWRGPHHRPPRNAGLVPPPPPTHPIHKKPGEGIQGPLSLCELSAPYGRKGTWMTLRFLSGEAVCHGKGTAGEPLSLFGPFATISGWESLSVLAQVLGHLCTALR